MITRNSDLVLGMVAMKGLSMTDNRKCSFYIYPERNAADRVADGFLEKLPQKERGRAMRAMMLCGAALMKQDERLPS